MASKGLKIISMWLCILLLGCGNKTLTPEEFLKYHSKNKGSLIKEREIENIKFEAEYVPSEVLCLHEFNGSNFKETLTQKNIYDSCLYFKFSISSSDENASLKALIKNKENLAKLKGYIMSEIINDFQLEIGKSRLSCGVINPELDLSMRNNLVFLMCFEKPNQILKEDFTLVFNDKIFQNGTIKFTFDNEYINSYPKIKLI